MLAKWFETTSMNGAVDWYESRSSKPHFIFWTIVMVTMIICCVFFTYKTVEDYIVQPTQTTMQTQQVPNMDLPEVLICFNGGLNVEAMRQSGFSLDFISNLHSQMKSYSLDANLISDMDQEIKRYMQNHDINMKYFMQNFTYSCKDILRRATRNVTCDQNVDSLYSTFFGQCTVFRISETQLYPGIDDGIEFHLKTPPNSFYELFPSRASEDMYSNSFSVSVDKKFGWITRKSSLVPANSRSELILQPTRYIRSASSKPCDNGSNVYSSNTCFHRCYAKAMYDFCGCYVLEYLDTDIEFNSSKICTPTDPDCALYTAHLAQTCHTECKPKCDQWVYSTTVTYAFLEQKHINESVAIVSIGYDTLGYMEVCYCCMTIKIDCHVDCDLPYRLKKLIRSQFSLD